MSDSSRAARSARRRPSTVSTARSRSPTVRRPPARARTDWYSSSSHCPPCDVARTDSSRAASRSPAARSSRARSPAARAPSRAAVSNRPWPGLSSRTSRKRAAADSSGSTARRRSRRATSDSAALSAASWSARVVVAFPSTPHFGSMSARWAWYSSRPPMPSASTRAFAADAWSMTVQPSASVCASRPASSAPRTSRRALRRSSSPVASFSSSASSSSSSARSASSRVSALAMIRARSARPPSPEIAPRSVSSSAASSSSRPSPVPAWTRASRRSSSSPTRRSAARTVDSRSAGVGGSPPPSPACSAVGRCCRPSGIDRSASSRAPSSSSTRRATRSRTDSLSAKLCASAPPPSPYSSPSNVEPVDVAMSDSSRAARSARRRPSTVSAARSLSPTVRRPPARARTDWYSSSSHCPPCDVARTDSSRASSRARRSPAAADASSSAIRASSSSTCNLASDAAATSGACADRTASAEAAAASAARYRSSFSASARPGRSSQLCFAGGPMCDDGGFSRRCASAAVSPAARARASCVAWLSAVARSSTPARSNARFISPAHADRVSSSHDRGFVRSVFLAPPDAGSPFFGDARRNHCSAPRSNPSFTRSENTRWR